MEQVTNRAVGKENPHLAEHLARYGMGQVEPYVQLTAASDYGR
jgi:hypothetical protein